MRYSGYIPDGTPEVVRDILNAEAGPMWLSTENIVRIRGWFAELMDSHTHALSEARKYRTKYMELAFPPQPIASAIEEPSKPTQP